MMRTYAPAPVALIICTVPSEPTVAQDSLSLDHEMAAPSVLPDTEGVILKSASPRYLLTVASVNEMEGVAQERVTEPSTATVLLFVPSEKVIFPS